MEPEVHEKRAGEKQIYAATLHVRSSPISQPIKVLKQRVGQVLVVRESPCTATAAGVPLLRLAARTLESEALAEMGGDASSPRTRIAWPVNADSMTTWLTWVFGRLDHAKTGYLVKQSPSS